MELFLFTLLGIVLVLAAVGAFFVSRNKNQQESPDDYKTRTNFVVVVSKKSDEKKELKDLISPMETIFYNLAGIKEVVGRRHITFEIATEGELITFYVSAPKELEDFVEKQITSQYPEAQVDRAPYPNIFPEKGKVVAAQLKLKKDTAYPIRTYQRLETDGLNSITNALSKLADQGSGATIQLTIRPTLSDAWQKKAQHMARTMLQGKGQNSIQEGVIQGLGEFVKTPGGEEKKDEPKRLSSVQEEVVTQIENKANRAGFEVVVRLIAAAPDEPQARLNLRNLTDSFLQFGATELNSFAVAKVPEAEIIKNYVLRQFGKPVDSFILGSEELATVFHFPHAFIETPNIKWLRAKRLPAPEDLPKEGIVVGKNAFRGMEKTIRMERDDRRRHMYVIGKTGTGKSTWMQNMAYQDILAGEGVCFIDPHGSAIEWLLERIPKERVDDVIHFYPPDMERPLGLNLLEAKTATEKDMVVSEMISIFYKLFDPQGSGVVGPIFEHYMRNAMLLLMSDPEEGATLIDIPRLFTDDAYRFKKLRHVTDPTVQRFWQEEFVQAQKSNQIGEMFSYLISKIGRFISNEMMRNIVGQEQSAFDIRDVMDNKKILLVNLAKGLTGDINSNMLGFIIVSKMQMAALSRADDPHADYPDFYLYIDEFQNITTDSIATILSEARKYKLNMIVAHQFMAQLEDNIRDAVLGNVGSKVAFTVGAQDAEVLVKDFAPEVSENDMINIENYNAYIKEMIHGSTSKPFTLKSLAPLGEPNPRISQAIRQLARLKFGRDRRIVENQLQERLKYTKGQNLDGDLT